MPPPPPRPPEKKQRAEKVDPEYLAAFEREMQRRRDLPPTVGDDDGGADSVVTGFGWLFLGIAVLLPLLSALAAAIGAERTSAPLVLPSGLVLRIITEGEAKEATPQIAQASAKIAWAGASKREIAWTGGIASDSGTHQQHSYHPAVSAAHALAPPPADANPRAFAVLSYVLVQRISCRGCCCGCRSSQDPASACSSWARAVACPGSQPAPSAPRRPC